MLRYWVLMSLVVFGINHKTASLELREQVAFSPDTLVEALNSLNQQNSVEESVILSTCNRTEIYINADAFSAEEVCQWLADFHGIEKELLWEKGYNREALAVVNHVMQVASGLDSMILGEPQILGQLKQAFTSAKNSGTVNSVFEQLFQQTFSVAKQVRTETEIGANSVSVAYSAVQLAQHIFSALNKSRVLLVGAGETIDLVATHLKQHGVAQMTVANRTLERGREVADKFSASVITLAQIPQHLHDMDIVISSTASQLPIIGKGLVESAIKERRRKPMLFIDLAVPRDIESEVSDLDDAYLYTVDDLQQIVEQNLANRETAAEDAEVIIQENVEHFHLWNNQQSSIDLLLEYRNQSESVKSKLQNKAMAQLDDGRDPKDVIEELANKLTNSLMHAPTSALKKAAQQQDQSALELLKKALGVDN